MCSFLLYCLWLPCFVLTPEEAEMGYGLRQHETDGYKSPQSISKALMNRGDHAAPRTRSHPVAFLHPAPAKQIFKDLGENFSISSSILLCGKLVIGAWKIPQPSSKGQFQTSLSSRRGIIAESITFITVRRHKALVATVFTRSNKSLSMTLLFTKFCSRLVFNASRRGNIPTNSFSFATPRLRYSVKTELGSTGQFNLRQNGCGSMRWYSLLSCKGHSLPRWLSLAFLRVRVATCMCVQKGSGNLVGEHSLRIWLMRMTFKRQM